MSKIISFCIAVVLSFFLFALMNLLIDSEARAKPPEEGVVIDFGQFDMEDLKPETKSRKMREPEPFQEPVKQPQISTAQEAKSQVPKLKVAKLAPKIAQKGHEGFGFGAKDFVQNVNQNGAGRAPAIRIEPHYPPKALHKEIEGSVTLQFDITEDGDTTNIRILESTPKGYFEKASKKALRKWKYKKEEGEETVAALNQVVTLTFKLEE